MAFIRMRFPEGRCKTVTLSYDDGVINDFRFIETIRKYGLKCTFNLNSGCWADSMADDYMNCYCHRRMTHEKALELYKDSGYEVAVHGVTHPFFERIPQNACVWEISQDRSNLERDFGCIVRGAAYPFGTYSDEVVEILKMCGIVYCRTVNSTYNFDLPRNWLTLDPTCHHRDERLGELKERFLSAGVKPNTEPMMFYLWGHSYEYDWLDQWDVLESFGRDMGGHDDIWYATNIEIYDYVDAFKSLRWSNDMTSVYNPTCTKIWFTDDNKLYSIEPGQTLRL